MAAETAESSQETERATLGMVLCKCRTCSPAPNVFPPQTTIYEKLKLKRDHFLSNPKLVIKQNSSRYISHIEVNGLRLHSYSSSL